MAIDAIEKYKARRQRRLDSRNTVNEFKWRRVARMLARFDADGDDENQNNKAEAPKEGHGNTRLPFGLCKRFGIEIDPSWTPKDAWAALAGHGITAEGAYARLKRGEDPGTPDAAAEGAEGVPPEPVEPETPAEPPKEPKKTVEVSGREYGDLKASHYSWDKKAPWRLRGSIDDETLRSWEKSWHWSFRTKADMMRFLKEKGVEEFVDPETGEIVNPAEMDFPEAVMKSSDGTGYYTALSLGVRDGRYTIFGTDTDGKKWRERDFPTLARALAWLKERGVDEDKLKLSPALKKREKDRLSWMDSDKKEYFDYGGKRFGNIKLEKGGWADWRVVGETEDGEKQSFPYKTKSAALSFLAGMGVEKVKDASSFGGMEINPMEYKAPNTVAEFRGIGYQKFWYSVDSSGKLKVNGLDVDGEERTIAYQPWSTSLSDFKKSVGDEIDLNLIEADEETKKHIAKIEEEEAEKERRKREFEEKAVKIGFYKYMDPEIVRDSDGDYKIVGYDKDGRLRNITYGDDMYTVLESCKNYGVDPESLIKDESIRDAYDKHIETMREFDAKAVEFDGRKVADLELEYDGGEYKLRATDYRGRRRTIYAGSKFSKVEDALSQNSIELASVPLSEEAKAAQDHYRRSKEALATGNYFSFGDDDEAYTSIRAEKGRTEYHIYGTDVDGEEKRVMATSTWDDVVKTLEDKGVKDYKIKVGDKEMPRPNWGMHDISIRKNKGTDGYTVMASSKKFGDRAIMFEGISEEECRSWLEKNNVDSGSVKTRGMNPNDDVPRTHTAKSLANFDTYREAQVEKCPTVMNLSLDEKQQTANMLTDLFSGSAYRMRADSDLFEKIYDTHFKNLLETGSSGGSSYKPGRRETHQRTFGGDYNVKPIDAEKYGFLGSDDDLTAFGDSTGSHYGDMVFKFKKDAVAERTTYTFGDSLDRDRPLAGYAGAHPTIEGVTGLTSPYSDSSDKVRNILDAYKQYKAGDITCDDLRKKIVHESYSSYIECQYHGMLTFKDVESVTMSKYAFERMTSKIPTEKKRKMLSFFKEHGIKVQYEDNGVLHDGTYMFEV